MNTMTKFIFVVLALASMAPLPAFADGEVCSASEKKTADGMLRKAEDAEKAGKLKDAYKAATQSIPAIHCAGNGYKRRDGVVERTSKKLGAESEKSGKFGEAHEYFSAPFRMGRVDYPLADADRTMLKHAKANPDNYKVVSQAASYFDQREGKPHLKEVRDIAKNSGDKALTQEEKSFKSNRKSFDMLEKARGWLEIAGQGKLANARAEQRGDALLADSTVSSVELAMQYYNFADSKRGEKKAQERARQLGDDAARKGDNGLAAKFYELSGDEAKAAAVEKQKEKAEVKRQDKFKQDQKSLEKELGL